MLLALYSIGNWDSNPREGEVHQGKERGRGSKLRNESLNCDRHANQWRNKEEEKRAAVAEDDNGKETRKDSTKEGKKERRKEESL